MRRTDRTSARDSLNGYQKGKCFYSRRVISLLSDSPNLAHVDHFLPHLNKRAHAAAGGNLDGVWNLVLAHGNVNLEKGARIPTNGICPCSTPETNSTSRAGTHWEKP